MGGGGQVAPESQCLCRLDSVKGWPGAPPTHTHSPPTKKQPPRRHTPLLLALFLLFKKKKKKNLAQAPGQRTLGPLPQAGRPKCFMSAVGKGRWGGMGGAPQETGRSAGQCRVCFEIPG